MKKIANISQEMSEEIEELVESGETLLFVSKNGKYIVDRAELNDNEATVLDCQDGSISVVSISFELVEMFKDASCYQDVQYKITIND